MLEAVDCEIGQNYVQGSSSSNHIVVLEHPNSLSPDHTRWFANVSNYPYRGSGTSKQVGAVFCNLSGVGMGRPGKEQLGDSPN